MRELVAVLEQQREAADTLLLGRTSFEEMHSYWPKQTDDPTGIADYQQTPWRSTWLTLLIIAADDCQDLSIPGWGGHARRPGRRCR